MNKIRSITIALFILVIVFWSYFYSNSKYDKQIIGLNKTIQTQKLQIERLKKKEKIMAKIEKYRNIKRKIIENKLINDLQKLKSQKGNDIQVKVDIKKELINEKTLDIKFYSQFPLDIATGVKYDEPYQNFCEESSLLNWYYYLIWKQPSLKEYNKDLLKLKEIEDLILDWWYKHTSLEDTLKLLIAFQEDDQKVFWEIIQNPTLKLIKENISKWNPVIVPLYWKWLTNPLFREWWPIYHNIIIKGFKNDIFIVNEVWVSNWDWFKYKQDELMNNIYNYDSKYYPNNFTKWKQEILILYK